MSETLTFGKWRGLQTSSTVKHVFCILAFDQRGSYRKMLPENTSYDEAVQIKREIVVHLSQYASAVLLDPVYGMQPAAYMDGRSGLLLSVEKSGYSGDASYRRTEFLNAWDVAKIKRVGASAVKLMIYYHPDSGDLAEELEAITTRVIDECRAHDLPLYLEPMSYSLNANIPKESAEYARERPQVVIETARRLSKLKPDVLKLEFPHDAAFNRDEEAWRSACEEISAASSVPWVLLSAGVDFETFEKQTEIACKSGASGFLAGRAIWKEAATMSTKERGAFLNHIAGPRIQRLIEIAEAHARPWTEFFELMPAPEDWFERYP